MLAGGGARIYFIILTAVFSIAVVIALATRFISGRVARWSIVLVTAGGLANLIDRVIYGYVQDMFKVELFNFAVFNVADIFITVFAILFAIAMIFEKESVFDDADRVLFENDDEEADRPSRRRREERAAAKEEAAARRRPKMELEELAYKAPEKRRPKAEREEPAGEKRRSRVLRDEEEAEVRRERNQRRARYEEEFEQFKATKPAANAAAAAAAAQKQTPSRPADPFAEWEKATAQHNEKQMNSPAAKAAEISPEMPKPVVSEPVPVKEKPVISDSFDLDDILNEFK